MQLISSGGEAAWKEAYQCSPPRACPELGLLRFMCWAAVFAAVTGGGVNLEFPESGPVCANDTLPIETPSNDKEQRQSLLEQANNCVREGNPARAVALLSQIIKMDHRRCCCLPQSWRRTCKRWRGGT